MIGILLALQVNNWNEGRKRAQSVKVYFQNLIDDFDDDIENFKSGEMTSTFRYYSAQYLIELTGEPLYNPTLDGHFVEEWKPFHLWNEPIPDQYNREFIQLAFVWTHRVDVFEKASKSIDVLRQTSEYSFFKNNTVKDAIDDYYNERKFRFGSESKMVVRAIISVWQNGLMDKGVLSSTP